MLSFCTRGTRERWGLLHVINNCYLCGKRTLIVTACSMTDYMRFHIYRLIIVTEDLSFGNKAEGEFGKLAVFRRFRAFWRRIRGIMGAD